MTTITRPTETKTTDNGGHTLELYTYFTTKEYNKIKLSRIGNKNITAQNGDDSFTGNEAQAMLDAFIDVLIARLDGETDKAKIRDMIDNMPAVEGDEIGTLCAEKGSQLFFSVMTSLQKSPMTTPQHSAQTGE